MLLKSHSCTSDIDKWDYEGESKMMHIKPREMQILLYASLNSSLTIQDSIQKTQEFANRNSICGVSEIAYFEIA